MRYVAELLGAESPMHKALALQKDYSRGRGNVDSPALDPAWTVVDLSARLRREIAYGTLTDMLLVATSLNSALQSSVDRVA